MKHLVESPYQVHLVTDTICHLEELRDYTKKIKYNDIILFSLPKEFESNRDYFLTVMEKLIDVLPNEITIGVMGENEDLAYLSYTFETQMNLNYGTWISLRKKEILRGVNKLPNETAGLIFFTKKKKLKLERVLLPYTYCPSCGKTTKDYGGKKHTFHEFGTTMSDVWKDIFISENEMFPEDILDRIRAMFSTDENRTLFTFSLHEFVEWETLEKFEVLFPPLQEAATKASANSIEESSLYLGDSLDILQEIPDSSIDYVFVDPPYNLKKKYASYDDALEIEEYFTWCDKWLEHCYRALKPGKYLTILNIPNWSIRHYAYLMQKMELDSWITWDALSKPSGKIMPANYTLLTFRKKDDEKSEDIITEQNITVDVDNDSLLAQADYYCLRSSCRKNREPIYKELTDLWTDIHRVKHNSRRYDHPCQLPPELMNRLIGTYTTKDDIVMDCFNGVGTTTVSADSLIRKYVGIELDPKYHDIAKLRHDEITQGLDPFRKNEIASNKKAKNNTIRRIEKRREEHKHITKKEVQLLIKDLAIKLGYTPTKEDAIIYLPDIPEDFYDLYFSSWSDVTVAVNVGGVTESSTVDNYKGSISSRREDTIVSKKVADQLKLYLLEDN